MDHGLAVVQVYFKDLPADLFFMRKNKSGFTLIEIIVVLIILGILASIALIGYFRMIESSRASEALIALGECRKEMDACNAVNGSYQTCAVHTIDTDNFTYSSVIINPNSYIVIAYRRTDSNKFIFMGYNTGATIILNNGNYFPQLFPTNDNAYHWVSTAEYQSAMPS
jgi:type IV pilus assembly protein PilE